MKHKIFCLVIPGKTGEKHHYFVGPSDYAGELAPKRSFDPYVTYIAYKRKYLELLRADKRFEEMPQEFL